MDCTVFTYILKYNLIPYGFGTIVGVSTTRCIVCYPPCSIKAGSHEYTCPEAYAGVGGLAENSISWKPPLMLQRVAWHENSSTHIGLSAPPKPDTIGAVITEIGAGEIGRVRPT